MQNLSDEEKLKYSRQIILEEMDNDKQILIKNSKALIVGCGGLGSGAIQYLAGAGIGCIGLMDYDKVEIHNLHRQTIHNINSINKNKAISAKEFIEKLNPDIQVIAYDCKLEINNALDIIKNYDIILDCCDNPKTRYLINDSCVILNKPLVSGASIRWDGQLTFLVRDFNNNKLPCYRCLYPTFPNNAKKCNEIGVIGTAPGIIGTLIANECIKYIIGLNDKLLIKKMLIYDGLDMKIKIVKTRGERNECIVCGENKIINENNLKEEYYK